MTDYLQFLLAQGADTDAAPAPAEQTGQTTSGTQEADPSGEQPVDQPRQSPFGGMAVPLILMLVVMYFLMFRGPKKKQKQRQQMLDNMKKNDRIQTIGGIIGTVVDLRDDEVVIKIDEATNSKMRVTRGAVSRVVTGDDQ